MRPKSHQPIAIDIILHYICIGMKVTILYTTDTDGAKSIKNVAEDIITTHHTTASILPITMGGSGFLDAAAENIEGCHCMTAGIRNRHAIANTAEYLITKDGKTAYIEAFKACGFDPDDSNRNPAKAFTLGVGDLIIDALRNGCRNFVIGIEELATIDAGIGMLNAIGYKILTPNGNELPLYRGSEMLRAASIVDSEIAPLLKRCRFTVAINDDSAFYASTGPSMRHARQLGANDVTTDILDNGLRNMASLYFKHNGRDVSYIKGGGAGGGMAGALASFFNAKLKAATSIIPGAAHINAALHKTDAVIIICDSITPAIATNVAFQYLITPVRRKAIPIYCLARHTGDITMLKNLGITNAYATTDIPTGLLDLLDSMHKKSD